MFLVLYKKTVCVGVYVIGITGTSSDLDIPEVCYGLHSYIVTLY